MTITIQAIANRAMRHVAAPASHPRAPLRARGPSCWLSESVVLTFDRERRPGGACCPFGELVAARALRCYFSPPVPACRMRPFVMGSGLAANAPRLRLDEVGSLIGSLLVGMPPAFPYPP